jgi:hypothetical protein
MLYSKLNLADDIDDITARAMNCMETIAEDCLSDISTHDHDSLYLTKVLANASYWSVDNGHLCNADMLQGSHASDLLGHGASLPIGAMIFWDGLLGSIPAGWYLADGNNGTMDMRNYFPVGTSSTFAIGATRGSATNTPSGSISDQGHALTVAEMPRHLHDVIDYYFLPGTAVVAVYTGGSFATYQYNYSTKTTTVDSVGGGAAHVHSRSTWSADAISNLPPYIALYIIERVF